MSKLYTALHQCVYSYLDSSCRHKQNTAGTSVWNCFYTEALDGKGSWEVDTFILLSPPYPNSQGAVCTHVHFWVAHGELAVLTNVGIQTDNIHIMDFFPLLYTVVRFRGLGSTPVQGISNIYWRILYIGVRAKFIFQVRIITQEFSKLTAPDRNNLITSVSDFLTSLESPHTDSAKFLQCSRRAYVDWAYIVTRAKSTLGTQRLPSSLHSTRRLSQFVPQVNVPPAHYRHE